MGPFSAQADSHGNVNLQCRCGGWFLSGFEEERLYCDDCAYDVGWNEVTALEAAYYTLGPVPPEGVGR